MCGIIGAIGKNLSFIDIEFLNNIQRHRGPDYQGIYIGHNIILGHQRLSILDLNPRSNQPLRKEGLVIVYNGELYNFKELKKELQEKRKINFMTSSDTEVILEMYRIYGINCVKHFTGMFAFAIFDENSNSLFIARDHFGIKPLYYTVINNTFIFSSELKTLTKIKGFKKEINPNALVSAINYLWISGNETMFKSCLKLPPAHFLKINNINKIDINNLEIKKYWELPERTLKKSEKEIKKELSEIIINSIKRHMIADVPISSFLSGGLDSSLISVIAKKINNNLSTYTIATENKDKKIEQMPDDEKYAKILAKIYNFNHHEITINANIIKNLPFIVRTLDEPIGDPAAINTFLICNASKKRGVKVLLSGMGADEIFFGYRRHKAMILVQNYQMLPLFIRKIIKAFFKYLPVKLNNKGLKIIRWIKRFLTFADLPIDEAYMRSYSYYSKNELYKLFTEKYYSGIEYIFKQHKNIFFQKFYSDLINQICYTDIQMFLLGLNLTYTDRASMAASVEVRVPFIDKEVIEYVMQIPGKYKYKKGQTKYILKKVAEEFLPKEIIYRPKASFGAPIRSWISNDLKDLVDDLLSEENIKKRGFFNYKFIKKIIDDDRMGKEDNAYKIYQLLTLELWCREFLDK